MEILTQGSEGDSPSRTACVIIFPQGPPPSSLRLNGLRAVDIPSMIDTWLGNHFRFTEFIVKVFGTPDGTCVRVTVTL